MNSLPVRKKLSTSRAYVFGLFIIAAFALVAIFAPLLAPHDPYASSFKQSDLPPMWVQKGNNIGDDWPPARHRHAGPGYIQSIPLWGQNNFRPGAGFTPAYRHIWNYGRPRCRLPGEESRRCNNHHTRYPPIPPGNHVCRHHRSRTAQHA